MDHLTKLIERARGASLNGKAVQTTAAVAIGLFALHAAIRQVNISLSQRALNNWTTDKWDWSREIVLVTGGSGGIGSEIISRFKSKGIKVINIDAVAPKDPAFKNVPFYQVDLTSEEDVARVAQQIREDIGHPTVVINNAGIGYGKLILDVPVEKVRKVFEVNIIAHFTMIREFIHDMIKHNHGHIVTVASMASFASQASNVDYACTKAGAMAFNEGLGQELAHYYGAPKVRTSCVHPIWVRTPMIDDLVKTGKFDQPIVEPGEVADAVVEQVLAGNSSQIVVPKEAAVFAYIRAAPLWLQTRIRNGLSLALKKHLQHSY